MEAAKEEFDVYSPNSVKLGQMDDQGVVRAGDTVIFRVENGAIYSMHGGYLGKLINGVGKTNRGEMLFSLRSRNLSFQFSQATQSPG